MGHVHNLYITFAALFTLIIPSVIATGANWDSGKTSDFFLYPEQREKLPAQKLAPADGDTIQAIWVQSTEQSAFEFVCCEPEEEACGKFFRLPITVSSENIGKANAFNFTFQYGARKNCILAINQIEIDTRRKDDKDGFETYPFDVREATGTPRHWIENKVVPSPAQLDASNTNTNTSGGVAPYANPAPVSEPGSGGPACGGRQAFLESCAAVNLTDGPDLSQGVDADCLDPPKDKSSAYYDKCWKELKLDKWIPAWIDMRFPGGINDTSTLWTTRFLREVETTTCGVIANPGCFSLEADCDPSKPYYAPNCGGSEVDVLSNTRRRYVSYAIRQIWSYFDTIYSTTITAISDTADQVEAITKIVNPVKDTRSWLVDLFVSVASAVIGMIPYVGPTLSIMLDGAKTIGEGLSSELPQFSVLKNDFAPNTEESQDYQDITLVNKLQGPDNPTKKGFTRNLEAVLNFIQGGRLPGKGEEISRRFLDLAGKGDFTAQTPVVAPKLEIAQNIQTYVITLSLALNGYDILMLPSIMPAELSDSRGAVCPKWAGDQCNSKTVDHLGCKDGVDPATGMCGYLWYSPGFKSAFTLVKKEGKTSEEDVKSILLQLFGESPPFSNGVSLFEGAAKCALGGMFPEGANATFDVWRPPSIPTGVAEWGFSFDKTNFPWLTPDSIPPEEARDPGKVFVPINGRDFGKDNAFVELSKSKGFFGSNKERTFAHPEKRLFEVGGDGKMDFGCLSQLNVSVANSWGGKDINGWRRHVGKLP